ncbi:transporter associated domain-containing protein [Gracilibacillus dipsosauri]|uniref:transporter associated domain-containing protein n=1 Tax=Gracilibacillus dipsosauri TaxID=178340 RepID=UPI0015E83BF0
MNDNTYLIDGKTSIQVVNAFFEITLINENVDTISGWILNKNIDEKEETVVPHDTLKFKVTERSNKKSKIIY